MRSRPASIKVDEKDLSLAFETNCHLCLSVFFSWRSGQILEWFWDRILGTYNQPFEGNFMIKYVSYVLMPLAKIDWLFIPISVFLRREAPTLNLHKSLIQRKVVATAK